MARREPRPPTALKVRVTFAPPQGTPACVAHADEPIVPGPRRTVVHHAPATQREAGPTPPVGSRHASCAGSQPPATRAWRRTTKRPRPPSPAQGLRYGSGSPWMGWSSQPPCSFSRQATGARQESGQRWRGAAMSAPLGPAIVSRSLRRSASRAHMPIRSS